jgi:DNA polymerase elongation subunit (family B)
MWADILDKYYNNEYDHLLILRIALHKRLDEYVNITPQVQAAMKLKERGEPVRIGEKMSFIVVDVNGKEKIAEPVNDNLEPEEAIKQFPKLTRAALDYYWEDRIWDNIKPFLELVLTDREVRKISFIREKRTSMDRYFQ